jgi:hypothetical protein
MTCICEFDDGCRGTGVRVCVGCGGDFCVCAECFGHGETDCWGCEDCDGPDTDDWTYEDGVLQR